MERRAAKLSTENDEVEETRINIANVIDPGEAIELINRYEETMTLIKKSIGMQQSNLKIPKIFLRMLGKVDPRFTLKLEFTSFLKETHS